MIQIVKLSTGEELIGDIQITENNKVFIDKPRRLLAIPDQQTRQLSLQLIPGSLFTKEDKLELNTDHIVVFPSEPKNNILETYREETSPIVRAPQGLELP